MIYESKLTSYQQFYHLESPKVQSVLLISAQILFCLCIHAIVLFIHSLEGLRPSLNLLTNDGALLAEDDPLSLLGTSEEIVASIISWNLPPLIDRYIEAASNMHKGTIVQSSFGLDLNFLFLVSLLC